MLDSGFWMVRKRPFTAELSSEPAVEPYCSLELRNVAGRRVEAYSASVELRGMISGSLKPDFSER